jgi:hypothetical protein
MLQVQSRPERGRIRKRGIRGKEAVLAAPLRDRHAVTMQYAVFGLQRAQGLAPAVLRVNV